MRNLIAQDKLDILQELKFSLIRKNRHDLPVLMAKCGQLRLIEEPRNIFIKSLNGVQAAIFDLLLFEPQKSRYFTLLSILGIDCIHQNMRYEMSWNLIFSHWQKYNLFLPIMIWHGSSKLYP